MAWQRKTPFGYMVADGKLAVNAAEANAVREIFSRYISGEGYQPIAEAMSESGVCYHFGKPEWNKHMVKRVLENSKYAADIVTADTFECARNLRESKTANYRTMNGNEQLIRSKLTNLGGVRLNEIGGDLESRVTALLNELIADPAQLAPEPLDAPQPSAETLKLQNELNRELTKLDFDADCANALIFALAAEKYAELPNVTLRNELAALYAELSERKPLSAFDAELFGRTVSGVTLGADNEMTITIINNTIIPENGMEIKHELQFA